MAPIRGMDFARGQLLKYGWEEGKGLGRNESGISEALKPNLKFDKTGIGHNPAEQFTNHWWEHMFNKAANNINVCETENGVSVKVEDESFNITTKKFSLKTPQKNSLEYGTFLKTSTLTQSGEIVGLDDQLEELIEEEMTSSGVPSNLTDEQLFNICGGRTAHKGARHGLGLNGKLARIKEQERQHLNRVVGTKTNTKQNNVSQELLGKVEEERNHRSKQKRKKEIADKESYEDKSTGDSIKEAKTRKKKRKTENMDNTSGENDGGLQDLTETATGEQNGRQKRKKSKNTRYVCETFGLCNSSIEEIDVMTQVADSHCEGNLKRRRKTQIADIEASTAVKNGDCSLKMKKKKKKQWAAIEDKSAGSVQDDIEHHVLNKKRKKSLYDLHQVETLLLPMDGDAMKPVRERSKKKKQKGERI